MRSLRRIIPFALIFVAFSTGWIHAESSNAQFFGQVFSPDKVGIPGVLVTIHEKENGGIVQVVSGQFGLYRVTQLSAGIYDVKAELEGFEPVIVSDIRIADGETRLVDMTFSFVTLQEVVKVIAVSPRDSLQSTEARESAARDVGEALTRLNGIAKVRKGGIANDLVLRGFAGKDLNVLIDGQRVYGACPNNMDPSAFHVDFSEVDRIEVSKGPFDIRNQGSLGGAINIITQNPQRGFHASGNVSAGSYNFVNPSLSMSFSDERFSALGGFSYRSSHPYSDGAGNHFTEYANYRSGLEDSDAFRVRTGWAKMGFLLGPNHQIQVAYTRQEADHVLYPYLMMDAVYDDTDRVNVSYQIKNLSGILKSPRIQSYFTRVRHWMTDEFRTSSIDFPRAYSMGTYASTRVYGGKLEAELFQVTVGLEAFRGNWNARTELAGMAYRPQYSLPDVQTTSIGAYADYHADISAKLKIDLGGRVDRTKSAADDSLANTDLYFAYNSTRSTSATDVFPSARVHLSYIVSPGMELRLGVGHTVRVPDSRERYFALKRKDSDWVGNPELEPSRNTGAEGSFLFRKGLLMLETSLYYNSIQDFVTLKDKPKINIVDGIMNTQARSYENVNARIYGLEIQQALVLNSHLYFSNILSYTRGTKERNHEAGFDSANLAEIPPLMERSILRFDNGRLWAELEGIFASSQDRVNTDLMEKSTPGYGIANLRIGFEIKRARIWVGLNNIFDRQFAEHLSYQRDPFRSGVQVFEPGRNLFLNLSFVR